MLKSLILICLILLILPQSLQAANLGYYYPEYKNLIGRRTIAIVKAKTAEPFIGITSHHLPTAAPLLDGFFSQLKNKRPNIKTFVIIGPDHFERCRQKFVLSDQQISTMYGELKVDKQLLAEFIGAGVKIENNCFAGEHAIGVPANYIKKYFPDSQVVPLLLSYSAKNFSFQKTVAVLKKNQGDIFVLQSTDFSHYVNARQAAANDEISRKAIMALSSTSLTLKQVDSPGTTRLIFQLARGLNLKPEILEHRNSFDYTGVYNNTTSYFSVFFLSHFNL